MAKIQIYYVLLLLLVFNGCNYLSEVRIIPELNAQGPVEETKEEVREEKAVEDSLFFDKKEEIAPDKVPIPKEEINKPPLKKSIQEIYMGEVGTMEKTGKNDGPGPKKYLKSVGLKEGFAYCAAFVRWCFDEAGVPTTITAWSPTAENKAHIIYANRQFSGDPEIGDVVTFYYPNLGRVGHCGFFDGKVNNSIYRSVEANTSDKGSDQSGSSIVREGQGVFIKYRSFNTTDKISRWIRK
jgi:hypothetical protein